MSLPMHEPDTKGFVRKFIGLAVGNYGAIILSVTLNAVLTWRMGTAAYGRLALLLMAAQVLACVISNWSITALVRFGAQELATSGSIAESFWARLYVMAPWLAGAVVVLALAEAQVTTYLEVSVAGLWLVFSYFVTSSLLLTLGSVFQALQDMDRYAVTLFWDKGVAVATILLLPVEYASEALVIVGCYSLSSLLVSLWALMKITPSRLLPMRVSQRTLRNVWRFSAPLIVSTWAGLLGTHWVHFIIMKQFRPFDDLGLYSLAVQIAGAVQQLTIITSSLLLPHFSSMIAKSQEAEIKALTEKVLPYALVGFSLLLSACVLLAGRAIPVVFGDRFGGAAYPLILLMVATMALAIYNTFMPLVSAQGSTTVLTGITLISAGVNTATALWLIPEYGSNGAAASSIVGYWTAALFLAVIIQRRLGISALQCGVFGLPVLLTALCAWFLEGAYCYLAGLGAAAVSTYILVQRFGLFEHHDLSLLDHLDLPTFVKSGFHKVVSLRTN